MKNGIMETDGWDEMVRPDKKCENCGWYEEHLNKAYMTFRGIEVPESYYRYCNMFDDFDGNHGASNNTGEYTHVIDVSPNFYCNEWKAKGDK